MSVNIVKGECEGCKYKGVYICTCSDKCVEFSLHSLRNNKNRSNSMEEEILKELRKTNELLEIMINQNKQLLEATGAPLEFIANKIAQSNNSIMNSF